MRGPCWQFQQGTCQYGASCRFQHVLQPPRHSTNRRMQPQRFEQDVRDVHQLREWSNAWASTSGSDASGNIWQIRVMTYNVLADTLAFEHARELYNKVPRHLLRFSNRISQMRNEFKQVLPDILSLQEVDKIADFEDCLSSLGYHYQYAERSGDRADGCAIFWQAAKLKCKASRTIDFAKMGLRNNVAQVLILETCSGSNKSQVLVANTHTLFNPKRGEIKVAQIRIILEAIHHMSQQHGGNIPCIFMGDLNLTPDSALYEFIATGQLDCAAVDPKNMSGQQESRSHRPPSAAKRSPASTVQIERFVRPVAQQSDHGYAQPTVQSTVQSASAESAYDALENMIAMGRAASNQSHASSALQSARQMEPNSSLRQQTLRIDNVSTIDGQPQFCQNTMQTTVVSNGQYDTQQTSSMTAGQFTHVPSAADPSLAQDDSMQPAASAQNEQQVQHAQPVTPGAMLTGLALQVQEDRQPFLPFGKSSRNVAPSLQDQPCADTPPLQVSAMTASVPGIGSTPSSAMATGYRRSSSGAQNRSGRQARTQGGMDRSQLATAHTREVHDPAAAIHHVLEHPLQLQSAYMEVTGCEPKFTSCHDKFCGTVDYIWFSQAVGKHVKPLAVLNPPDQHLIGRGLPTALFPSDHVCIVCDFEISPYALF